MIATGKKVFYGLWIVVIVLLLIAYIRNPDLVTPDYIKSFISSYGSEMMLVYICLTLIRGFFLIPSTPFVIAGGIMFPDQLLLVLGISMIGVMTSATALYFFSDSLGFSHYLESKYPNKIGKLKPMLQDYRATYFVLGWSFFPLVPTDLICYVAGLVKMPFKYLFIGVFVGELILDIFYVYFGSSL